MPARLDHTQGFSHHERAVDTNMLREAIFGVEDGMVSTFGAIVGIAVATADVAVVIVSGCIIIAVESISMAVGSFLANKSEADIRARKLSEEQEQLERFPDAEEAELAALYLRSGWPESLAATMARTARADPRLFLEEMSLRELGIVPLEILHPVRNALVMGGSYIAGGLVPLLSFCALPLSLAVWTSAGVTLGCLFGVGSCTARYSGRTWWRAGLEMMVLASIAAMVGYAIGQIGAHRH